VRLLAEEDEEAGELAYDRLIMPKLVVSLDASDDFLRERVINLPEIVVVGTHNTDEAFSRRLTDYRAINTDEDTVLNYFDELEFHPERIGYFVLHLYACTTLYICGKYKRRCTQEFQGFGSFVDEKLRALYRRNLNK